MRKDKPYDKSVYQSLTLILQFGINMIVPIAMMTAAGIFLDQKLETSFLTVILFFVGAIAGAQNVYRMAKKVYETTGDKADIYIKGKESADENDRSIEEDK